MASILGASILGQIKECCHLFYKGGTGGILGYSWSDNIRCTHTQFDVVTHSAPRNHARNFKDQVLRKIQKMPKMVESKNYWNMEVYYYLNNTSMIGTTRKSTSLNGHHVSMFDNLKFWGQFLCSARHSVLKSNTTSLISFVFTEITDLMLAMDWRYRFWPVVQILMENAWSFARTPRKFV
jgi:hypothetical protein